MKMNSSTLKLAILCIHIRYYDNTHNFCHKIYFGGSLQQPKLNSTTIFHTWARWYSEFTTTVYPVKNISFSQCGQSNPQQLIKALKQVQQQLPCRPALNTYCMDIDNAQCISEIRKKHIATVHLLGNKLTCTTSQPIMYYQYTCVDIL